MTDPVMARWRELAPLVDRALEMDPAERDAFVAGIDDAELRTLLADLLAREAQAGFLDGSSASYAEALIAPPHEELPRDVGPYRLVARIGEGGSGSVYRAEREADGYVQRVALKLLRVGLRDPAEQARFRRERRILARLEHPAIARLIDGGFTGDGVPWFALELVEGETVTRWCDARAMDVDARLGVFLVVCDAVEAAHRALIVHRDIKPANILVDDAGRPKLLDFGIAKLLDDSEREDDTRTGLRRLTPAYAAPEQFAGGPVTTATDIYALGVLLHELLSGARPQPGDGTRRVSEAPLDDAVARARNTTPRALAQRLRGDLDTVVATALATEPERRYASVAALAADIRAHLEARPIAARPASAAYRLRKFFTRHRVGAMAAVLVVASIVTGVVSTWHESRRAQAAAQTARDEAARAAAVKDFVLALFAGVSPDESKGRQIGAVELVERGEARLAETLAAHPELKAELSTALAAAYRQLGKLDRAGALAQSAVDAGATGDVGAEAQIELGRVRAATGDYAAAETTLRAALARTDAPASRSEARVRLAELLVERGQPNDAQALLDAALASDAATDAATRSRDLLALGNVRFRAGDMPGAEANFREALTLAREAHGERHTATATVEHDLGVVLMQRGLNGDAEALLRQSQDTRVALLGERHPDVAETWFEIAITRQRAGDVDGAKDLYTKALDLQRTALGDKHPAVSITLNSLALLAWNQGDTEGAIERLREALVTARAANGSNHPTVATMLGNVASFERYAGRVDESLRDQREALGILEGTLGTKHYLYGIGKASLASSLAEAGDIAAARSTYAEALAVLDASLGANHADTAQARAAYAGALAADGDRDGALREAGAAFAAVDTALPAANPRRARVELVLLRVRSDCADSTRVAELAALLDKSGPAVRGDAAAAHLLLARCRHDAATREAADRALAALPYQPRSLRKERAKL